MFDIGWSEILVIAVVAVVAVGPKELPRMLRTFGKTMGQVRRTANDFKRQFDEALREAEREADLADTRDQLKGIMSANPLAEVRKDIDRSLRGTDAKPKPAEPVAQLAAVPDPAAPQVHEAEPVKTGATENERGTDAA